MVSTSGAQLLPPEAVKALRKHILPHTTILTPNLDEARLLLRDAGRDVLETQDLNGLKSLAKSVQSLGPQYVLLKGGHMPLSKASATSPVSASNDQVVVDVLVGPASKIEVFETDYIDSKHTHGTGCSLACKQRMTF